VGKEWEKKGDRILHKSISQPYFPLVAHKNINPEQIKEVQKTLLALTARETLQNPANR
jgi:ABC-type phosphate/phosphonate transport system substrate-binding protein